MTINLKNFEKEIGIKFKDQKLLKRALTHKSFDNKENYEILEFLGDRVLGLVISNKLINTYKEYDEGFLDKKLASLVNKNKCFEIGKKLKIDKHLFTKNKKDTNEKKIISDICEALIGLIFIEKGLEFVEKFILKNWNIFFLENNDLIIDSKTKLQEYSLKKFKLLPKYKLVSNYGPKHKPIFKIAVKLKDTDYFIGSGSSKQKAEQSAARKILINLNIL